MAYCPLIHLLLNRTKVHGVLPNLSLRISDKRVHEIMTLALSIPLPESAPVDEEPETEMFKV